MEAENTLEWLCRRYRKHRKTIHLWRRFLGLPTPREIRYFSQEEVKQLDAIYIATNKEWGLRMSHKQFERFILDAGIDLNQFLQQRHNVDLETFVERRERVWQIKIFGN